MGEILLFLEQHMTVERVHARPSASTSVSRDFCVIHKRLPDCVRGFCWGSASSVSSSTRREKKNHGRVQKSGRQTIGCAEGKAGQQFKAQKFIHRVDGWTEAANQFPLQRRREVRVEEQLASASGHELLNLPYADANIGLVIDWSEQYF